MNNVKKGKISDFSNENISVLLSLKKIYKILNCVNEKKIIKRLIDKRPIPFIFNPDFILSEKKLGYSRCYINKIYNRKIDEIFSFFDDISYEEKNDYYINYHKKDHWLLTNSDYIQLNYIRAQFYLQKNNNFLKSGLQLLNIYAEEKIESIIKTHYQI